MIVKCDFCHVAHSDSFHAEFNFMMYYDVISIIDENNGNKSVTNDIEYVLDTITKNYNNLIKPLSFKGLHHYKIIYKDSMGFWFAIHVDEKNKFVKFAPIKSGKMVTDFIEAFNSISTCLS